MFRHVLIATVVAAVVACAAGTASAQRKAQPGSAAAVKAATGLINLNSATVEQLDSLPGIGPKVAARIIEYRQKNGGFRRAEDIMNVKGIGEKLFLKIKDRITVQARSAGLPQ